MNEELKSEDQSQKAIVVHTPRKEAVQVNEDATPERIEMAVVLPNEGGSHRSSYQWVKRRIEELRMARVRHEQQEIFPRILRGETDTPELQAAEASSPRAYNEIQRLERQLHRLSFKAQREREKGGQ